MKAKAVSLSQIRTYTKKITKTADIEYPQAGKLIGERNSRTTVSLGIFGNSLLLSVMSDWVVTLAQSVQQWCVTLIRKNRDRKAVSKRERERERAESDEEGKEGQSERRGKSQTAAQTQSKRNRERKGVES